MTQPAMSDQATDLMHYLTEQREHMLGMLEHLPGEAMRRPVLPTGWTCAGLVQHLALDVERFWFRQVIARIGPGCTTRTRAPGSAPEGAVSNPA